MIKTPEEKMATWFKSLASFLSLFLRFLSSPFLVHAASPVQPDETVSLLSEPSSGTVESYGSLEVIDAVPVEPQYCCGIFDMLGSIFDSINELRTSSSSAAIEAAQPVTQTHSHDINVLWEFYLHRPATMTFQLERPQFLDEDYVPLLRYPHLYSNHTPAQ